MKYLGVLCFTLLCGCQSIVNPSLSVYHSDLHATADGIDTSSETILNAKQNGSYASEDSLSVTFAMEGLRVKVDPLSDDQLNSLFPEDSEKGQFSTNPYTYGNWVDPLKGYCPKRFTVFRVTVTNDIYAKVLLDPMKGTVDGSRDNLLFGIPASAPYESFEQYYRALRGQSGHEFIVTLMHGQRAQFSLFRRPTGMGESYSGLIAFRALQEQVELVEMVMRDFTFKFDASGQPLESLDIAVSFEHKVKLQSSVE